MMGFGAGLVPLELERFPKEPAPGLKGSTEADRAAQREGTEPL